jgi:hypothetical protein
MGFYMRVYNRVLNWVARRAQAYQELESARASYQSQAAGLQKQVNDLETRLGIESGIARELKDCLVGRDDKMGQLNRENQEKQQEIERLGAELGEARRELEHEAFTEAAYLYGARRLAEQHLRLKKVAGDLGVQLGREQAERDEIIQKGLVGKEDELRTVYRRDVAAAYKLCADTNDAMLARVAVLRQELDSQREESALKDLKLTRWKGEGVGIFLRAYGDKLGLDNVCGVYLDSEFKPAYATPKFLTMFYTSQRDVRKGEIAEILSGMDVSVRDKVLETARGHSESSLCLQVPTEGGRAHKLTLDYRYFLDKKNSVIGTFIEFNDADLGHIRRIEERWTKRKGRQFLELLFRTKPAPHAV